MPVRHDSPEWQGIITDVAALKRDVESIDGRLDRQAQQQDRRHEDNQERFRDLEAQVKDVRADVAELKDIIVEAKGVLEGLRVAAHTLKWTIGIVGALLTVGIAIMTLFGPSIRHSFNLPTSQNNQQHPAAISQREQPAFTAQE